MGGVVLAGQGCVGDNDDDDDDGVKIDGADQRREKRERKKKSKKSSTVGEGCDRGWNEEPANCMAARHCSRERAAGGTGSAAGAKAWATPTPSPTTHTTLPEERDHDEATFFPSLYGVHSSPSPISAPLLSAIAA